MFAVIFDLDGTLVESHEDVWDSIQFAFESIGYSFPSELRQDHELFSSSNLVEILQLVYPNVTEKQIDQYRNTFYRQYLEECNFEKTRLYPGIFSLLKKMNDNQIQLFVATMKSAMAAQKILAVKKINSFFTGIFCTDSFPEKKEKWEILYYILAQYSLVASECFMVGDLPTDMVASNLVGIPFIGVSWGYGQMNELINQEHFVLVDTVQELHDLFFLD